MTDIEQDHWADDDAELSRINDLLNDPQFNHPGTLIVIESIDDLEKMAELLRDMWQAEEEDTELDRDSEIFHVQQDEIQSFINDIVEEIRRREEA